MLPTRGYAWLPLVLTAAVMLPAGFLAQRFGSDALRELDALALSDPETARIVAADVLRTLALLVCVAVVGGSALLVRYFQAGLRQRQFPPQGWWPLATHRIARAGDAQRIGRVGLALALLVASLGLVGLLIVDPVLELLRSPPPGA